LGGRKGIRPVKKLRGRDAGVVICLERSADLHTAQLMPLPLTVSCFSKIQIGFTFLAPTHPGSPGQRAVKQVCVCVCLLISKLIGTTNELTKQNSTVQYRTLNFAEDHILLDLILFQYAISSCTKQRVD